MTMDYRNQSDFDIHVSDETVSDENSLSPGDSTRSLLTPLYASDYESLSDGGQDGSTNAGQTSPNAVEHQKYKLAEPRKCSTPKYRAKEQKQQDDERRGGRVSEEYDLLGNRKRVSWEDWVVRKTLESLEISKEKRLQERLKREEERKKEKEQVDKLKQAETKRKEWLEQKDYESTKKREEVSAHRKYKKLKEQQVKELTESRSKEKYDEWYKTKAEEELKRRKLKKEQEENLMKRMQERKTLNDMNYLKWLNENKRKSRTSPSENLENNSIRRDKHFDIFGTPSPDYVNPTPWVSSTENSKSEPRFNTNWVMYNSPPLLWKEYESRERDKKENSKRLTKVNRRSRPPRHSCI